MGIQLLSSHQEIERTIAKRIERLEKALIYNFNYVGTVCVNEAKLTGSYKDRTGNLRASIGYIIVKDGKIVQSGGFKGPGGTEGIDFAQKRAAEFPQGIALIVVAGMNYATHVEALNFNVLTSAELLAEKLVPGILKQLGLE